jgi:hypothetical protein
MSRVLAFMLAALVLLLPGTAALAQSGAHPGARVVERVTWVEEWDPARGEWVRIEESPAAFASAAHEAGKVSTTSVTRADGVTVTETVIEQPVRFIARPRADARGAGIAAYGPFRVLDERRAALVGPTDIASPRAFAAMMAAHPGLEVLEFADAPGTSNDIANLRVGRAIRAAGLATHVPAGGSARSGAVELFLAGTQRTIDPGALFAVHSWRDALGREPADFAPDAPENRIYLDYYTDMGMSLDQARAFYAMTNSVPHTEALWLGGEEMARWIGPDQRTHDRIPASRGFEDVLQAPLRLALARSAAVLAEGLLARLRTPSPAIAVVPRLAYADTGAVMAHAGAVMSGY